MNRTGCLIFDVGERFIVVDESADPYILHDVRGQQLSVPHVEQLEDLQVALGELLDQHETEREITVSVRVEGETIHTLIGPFDGTLERELARDSGDSVGLRRVLETVVDGIEVTSRDGQPWVELTKAVQR